MDFLFPNFQSMLQLINNVPTSQHCHIEGEIYSPYSSVDCMVLFGIVFFLQYLKPKNWRFRVKMPPFPYFLVFVY